MKCNHCGKEAKWVENKIVYNGKNYGKSYMIWWCKDCDAYVGCHNNTKQPKGNILAKRDLRKARLETHAFIDPIWKSKKYKRKTVYKRLEEAFGKPIHVGGIETVKECQEIIKTAQLLFPRYFN